METLYAYILSAFKNNHSTLALEINDTSYTYGELKAKTASLLNSLDPKTVQNDYVGIFASRSVEAFTAVYAVLLAGYGYVPLNPRFPPERTISMISQSGCKSVVLSSECIDAFRAVADRLTPLDVLCTDPACDLSSNFPHHVFRSVDWTKTVLLPPPSPSPNAPAYLLFTSGSTGTPKGVSVSHQNVCSYLHTIFARYEITSSDRLSQMFDLTFDLSVHDIFVALGSGAQLCVVPEKQLMAPYKFIRDKKITVWFSVPSVAMFMTRMRMLAPGAFPALRVSLFCGEALPEQSARQWQNAAPQSIVDNLYGPTEATISISAYRWDNEQSPLQCVNGVVPIGDIFPEHAFCLINANAELEDTYNEGELCLSGAQITNGYLNNSEETARRFVHLTGSREIWYKTGDLVRITPYGLVFLGRIDDQVQIRGYRAELQEIDQVLRSVIGIDLVAAVPVSTGGDGTIDTIYGYVESPNKEELNVGAIVQRCKERLPEYMAPSRIIVVDKLPLNSNGKIDRKELANGSNKFHS